MGPCSWKLGKSGKMWLFRTPLMLALVFAAGTCGKKTPPRPLGPDKPPQVVDIRAEIVEGHVQLTWPIPEIFHEKKRPGDFVFVVQREHTDLQRAQCPECPSEAVRTLARIDPSSQGPWRVEQDRVQWTDTSTQENAVYRYWIGIMDNRERMLSLSVPVRVQVSAPPKPLKKLETRADAHGVLVRWNAPTAEIKGPNSQVSFLIERRQKGLDWEALNPEFFQGNSYLDTSVQPQEYYQYRVRPMRRALDADVLGPWTESAFIQTPEKVPPPPPTTVWAVPSGENMEVYWAECSVPVSGYHVYRRDGKTIVRLTADPLHKPPFVDTKVKPDKVYSYAVSSVSSDVPYKEGLLSKWVEVRHVRFK
ncbi:fibronectin type III domain-containing protein [Desulfosoma caldarium]|uniref:Fibronectin type-III domain-containing protein n=1 Tax=Desulfosoma caldarium TaxID=610254 RepID=A0A3N1UWG1_9BACT|nr:fibronectin type III domain-containing protein [Desulfosoma caldarium]ROQ92261.1 hypothetical protein EDC27_1963 [Desulfosoma caldarium]